MDPQLPFIGIDFGTCNSAMAWYNPKKNHAEIIRNHEGEEKTPSIVYYGENETLVGKYAEEKLGLEDDRKQVVASIKRKIASKGKIAISGKRIQPVEVVAEILTKLKQDAEKYLFKQQPVKRAVITCPAVFTQQEKDKIMEAASLAGIEEVKLLAEPVAAALTYMHEGINIGNCVLVYDLGGGTFDLSVLRHDEISGFFDPVIEPRGMRCGGDDFDRALYDDCDKMAQQELQRPISLHGELDLHFLLDCRKRKENLSQRKRAEFSSYLSDSDSPVRFKYTIERSHFEGLIRQYLEPTIKATHDMLTSAKEEGHNVDRVLLIGGSARIPLVIQLLEETLPLVPHKFRHQDYAVAMGAAYYANSFWGEKTSTKTNSQKVTITSPADDAQKKKAIKDDAYKQYRRNLEMAWADQKLTSEELWKLNELAEQLELSMNETAEIDRIILGATKEEVFDKLQSTEKSDSAAAQTWLKKAITSFRKGEITDAFEQVQAACDLNPESTEAFYLKSQIWAEKEAWRLAVIAASQSLENDAQFWHGYTQRGYYRIQMNNFANAKDDFDQAISKEPSLSSHYYRAQAYFALNDLNSAISDLIEATQFSTGKQDSNLPLSAIYAILGHLYENKLKEPQGAADYYAKALSKLNSENNYDHNGEFAETCRPFGLIPDYYLLEFFQTRLWNVCKAIYGGFSRRSVVMFAKLISGNIEYSVWAKEPKFAFHMASYCADKRRGDAVVHWLEHLFQADPKFDVKTVQKDEWIAKLKNQNLRYFLTPKVSYTESHGKFFNNVTIWNNSDYRLTSIKVIIEVFGEYGNSNYKIQKSKKSLNAGESHSWDDVFKDTAWFGSNISRVSLSVFCAEGDVEVTG